MIELLSTRNQPRRAPRLGRDDWIAAGLAVLVEAGVEAVQITVLAKRLKVTRGSFYWHFEDRESLLDALLAEWRARNSGVMRDALDGAVTLEDGILELFAVWVDHTRFDPKLDHAIRDWARRDDALLAAVQGEDAGRVTAIAAFFERQNYETTEAFIRARVIYFTQLSYYALGVEEPPEQRIGYLNAYFRTFTGRDISAAAAEVFRRRMSKGRAA